MKGGALAEQQKSSRNLTIDSRLFVGETIVTGIGTRLAIEMTDGALITLGESTQFTI